MRHILHGLIVILVLITPAVYGFSYGPTAENEHLYQVALKLQPDDTVTVQQTMLAILHANPSAFNQKNINGLKSGYRLRIPSIETIQEIGPRSAARAVERQNIAWRRLSDNAAENKPHHKQSTKKAKTQVKDVPVQEKTVEANTPETVPLSQVSQGAMTLIPQFIIDTQKQQEQTYRQIANLQQQIITLEGKVNQLTDDLRTVTYHFIQAASKLSHQKSSGYAQMLNDNVKQHGSKLSLALMVFILLFYWFKQSHKQPSKVDSQAAKDNSQEEYDFMSSEESIPSKLDLARVYMDMGDYSAAESALKEVIEKGNEEQQQGARDLLGKMNFAV